MIMIISFNHNNQVIMTLSENIIINIIWTNYYHIISLTIPNAWIWSVIDWLTGIDCFDLIHTDWFIGLMCFDLQDGTYDNFVNLLAPHKNIIKKQNWQHHGRMWKAPKDKLRPGHLCPLWMISVLPCLLMVLSAPAMLEAPAARKVHFSDCLASPMALRRASWNLGCG